MDEYHGNFKGSTGINCIGIASSFHYDEDVAVIETTSSKKNLRTTSEIELKIIADDDSDPNPIANKKLKRSMELVTSNIIPRAHHGFYHHLNGEDISEETDQEDDIEEN